MVPHCEKVPIVVGTQPALISRILAQKLQSENEHREERKGRRFYPPFTEEKLEWHKDISLLLKSTN